jgi:hypothetical protein
MSRSSQRLIGVCGLLFVALQLPILIIPVPPGPETSVADATTYFTAHRDAFLFLNYLGALGLVPAVFFIAGLTRFFKRAEGPGGWLHLVYLMSSAIAGTLAMIVFWSFQVLASYRPGSGEVVKFALVMTNLLWAFGALAAIPATLAAGAIIVRHRALPAWIGYLAYVAAAALLVVSLGAFVGSGWLASGGLVTLAIFGLDVAVSLSIALTLVLRPRDLGAAGVGL